MSECTEQVDWLSLIEQDAAIATLSGAMEQGGTVRAAGRSGFSSVVVAAALQRFRPAPRLLVVAHIDEADEAVETLGDLGIKADRFPALEVLPGERVARMDLLGDRLSVVRSIGESPDAPRLLVAPIHALMQTVPGDDIISTTFRVLRPGESIEREALLDWLVAGGYQRVMTVEEQGEFAFRGDILDVFPLAGAPTRLDLEDDQISAICSIDLDTMGSEQRLDRLDLIAASINPSPGDGETRILLELLDDRWELMLDDLGEVSEQGRSYFHRLEDQDQVVSAEDVLACASRNLRTVLTIADDTGQADEFDLQLPIRRSPEFPPEASAAFEELAHRGTEDEIVVCCRTGGDATRFQELLDGFVEDEAARSRIRSVLQDVPHGFRWAPAGRGSISIISYDELISRVHMRRRGRARNEARPLDAFVDIEPGDFVVHREHGIASFAGLRVMARGDGPEEEFLTLEFARGSRLHVPAVDIELVQKYIGAFKGEPERSLLGGKSWARRKEKASDSVRELAHQMLSIQAARQSSMGMTFPPDTEWQHEFEAAFPWDETEDQLQAITAIKEDMQSTRPMDRLLCGDVGFGKTEVAIRAGFKAVESGRQVAVLVPTTVLAEQHDRTFSGRFAGFPFRVESLSRFKNAAAQRAVLEALASGEIDVLVGTHRILSSDVRFRNLGLVVIDEEQRFGVAHKQKLLQLRSTVDVLTMTATPIPRTLHMSMLGLRDISSLTTPPQDRRAVVTELISWDTGRIRDALRRELAREGQAFFVHNRVRDLDDIAHAVRTMVPGAEVVVGHGQMRPAELESVMLRFMRGEADILVCTTIIESGIDIPSANTMIINEADLLRAGGPSPVAWAGGSFPPPCILLPGAAAKPGYKRSSHASTQGARKLLDAGCRIPHCAARPGNAWSRQPAWRRAVGAYRGGWVRTLLPVA